MKAKTEIKDILIRYLGQHYRLNGIFAAETTAQKQEKYKKRELTRSFKAFLGFLSVLPYLCGALFVVSLALPYFVEKSLLTTTLFGYTLEIDKLMTMITVSGLIGYATNYVAIHMLFKPLQKRPIWGQGLIPGQRDRIIFQLSKGMHKHVLSEELIQIRIHESGLISRINNILVDGTRGVLEDRAFFKEIKVFINSFLVDYLSKEKVREEFVSQIDSKLNQKMQEGFKGFLFKTYKRTSKDDYDNLINNLINEIPATVSTALDKVQTRSDVFSRWLRSKKPDMEGFMTRLVMDVLERIDIQDLLARQMAHFDERKLEQMIWTATNEQLRYIQLLGTLLGILGGLLIWQPVVVIILYLIIFGFLFLLDIFLFGLKKRREEKITRTPGAPNSSNPVQK
ncbi:MAG: DUF445 family protein [Bacteroidia bacterium]|nr:DUF445 family protein [Bacteroidia bacterium]